MSKLVENDKKLSDEKKNIDSEQSNLKDDNKNYITLISQEGDKFKILKKEAEMSGLIFTMIKDDDDEDNNEDNNTEIPVVNVKSKILGKVIEFCKYHTEHGQMKEIEKPLKSSNMNDVVDEWDAEFVNVEQEELFEMILAANYLDIKSLLDLTCATVASKIKGKTPEEIRQTFNIVNDFTPEEEAQVREENKWCEEA